MVIWTRPQTRPLGWRSPHACTQRYHLRIGATTDSCLGFGRCLNLLSVTPLRKNLRPHDHATHAQYFQIIMSYYCWLVQFYIYIFFFLKRVFGNFHFISCYLPLFPFDLFGINLEFEPFHSKRTFLNSRPYHHCIANMQCRGESWMAP